MCGSMVDTQPATAEIRPGKNERRKETTGQKYNGLPISYGGHNNRRFALCAMLPVKYTGMSWDTFVFFLEVTFILGMIATYKILCIHCRLHLRPAWTLLTRIGTRYKIQAMLLSCTHAFGTSGAWMWPPIIWEHWSNFDWIPVLMPQVSWSLTSLFSTNMAISETMMPQVGL